MSTVFASCLKRGTEDSDRLLQEIEDAAKEVARLLTLAYGEGCRIDFLREHAVVMVRTRRPI